MPSNKRGGQPQYRSPGDLIGKPGHEMHELAGHHAPNPIGHAKDVAPKSRPGRTPLSHQVRNPARTETPSTLRQYQDKLRGRGGDGER